MLIPVIENGPGLFIDSAQIAIPWSSVFGRPAIVDALSRLPNGAGALVNDGAGNLSWASIGGGSVTSVGLAAPTGFTVTGSPVTGAGTLTFAYAPGYVAYTSLESAKLATIAAGATVGATWGVNVFSRPNILINIGALANAAGLLANDGAGNVSWYPTGSLGTVQIVNTGNGTTGGPITVIGTVSVDENYAFNWTGQHRWAMPLWASDGTAALPAYTFFNDPNTGAYSVGADNYGIATGGTLRWDVNATRTLQAIPSYIAVPVLATGTFYNVVKYYSALDSTNGGFTIEFQDGAPIGDDLQIRMGFWNRGNVTTLPPTAAIGFAFDAIGHAASPADFVLRRYDNSSLPANLMIAVSNVDQLQFPQGVLGAPGMSFIGDTNTGFYSGTGDVMRLACGGVQVFGATGSSFNPTVPIRGSDGSAAAPAYSFSSTGNNDNGMYLAAGDTLGWSAGGVLRLSISTTLVTSTLQWQGPAGTTSVVALSASGDPNTGWNFPGSDVLQGITAGAVRFQFGAAGQFGIGGATYGTAGQSLLSAGAAAAPTWGNPTLVAANFANPTNPGVNLVGANGTAITAMRSDAVLILSQAIVPTWTGTHTFTGATDRTVVATHASLGLIGGSLPAVSWVNSGAAANGKLWESFMVGSSWYLQTILDDLSNSRTALQFDRSGMAVTAMQYGNSTDNPVHTFFGPVTINYGGGYPQLTITNSATWSGFRLIQTGAVGCVIAYDIPSGQNWQTLAYASYFEHGSSVSGRPAWHADSAGGAITTINYGNSTDNPLHTFYGSVGIGAAPDSTFQVANAGAGTAGFRVGYNSTDDGYWDGATLRFRASNASNRSLMVLSIGGNSIGNSTDNAPTAINGDTSFVGVTTSGSSGAVASYWALNINGTPYKIPLHTP